MKSCLKVGEELIRIGSGLLSPKKHVCSKPLPFAALRPPWPRATRARKLSRRQVELACLPMSKRGGWSGKRGRRNFFGGGQKYGDPTHSEFTCWFPVNATQVEGTLKKRDTRQLFDAIIHQPELRIVQVKPPA